MGCEPSPSSCSATSIGTVRHRGSDEAVVGCEGLRCSRRGSSTETGSDFGRFYQTFCKPTELENDLRDLIERGPSTESIDQVALVNSNSIHSRTVEEEDCEIETLTNASASSVVFLS